MKLFQSSNPDFEKKKRQNKQSISHYLAPLCLWGRISPFSLFSCAEAIFLHCTFQLCVFFLKKKILGGVYLFIFACFWCREIHSFIPCWAVCLNFFVFRGGLNFMKKIFAVDFLRILFQIHFGCCRSSILHPPFPLLWIYDSFKKKLFCWVKSNGTLFFWPYFLLLTIMLCGEHNKKYMVSLKKTLPGIKKNIVSINCFEIVGDWDLSILYGI